MALNGKTLKDIVDEVFSIKEEKAEYDNAYLKNTAGAYIAYTTSILFKLVYLLPREEQGQDKNHWKGELISPLSNMLFNLGGVKSSKLILDKFYEKTPEAFSVVLKNLKTQYSSLMSPKELTTEMIDSLAEKYYPSIAVWLFDNYKEVQKLKDKIKGISTIKARELVNSWFE